MSNTSDQTTKQNNTTRLIVDEIGIDTETGIVGKGHSYDNGKTFVVDNTIYGRIYHADDNDKIWKGIQDQVTKVVAPAKSAADSAQSTADAAVASAQVTSDAVTAIASATAEAKQGANAAMSRAKSAWDVATGAKEAVTDFDPLLKSAQSNASEALTQIANTASALSDAKTEFGSDVAEAKQTADSAVAVASGASSNAMTAIQTASQASITAQNASGQAASAVLTANGAQTTASNAESNATVAIQTASGASLTATNAQSDATIAKQTASEATVQASNAESDFAQLSIRAGQIEANVATNSGAIASVQQTANGLTTTVADIKSNGGGVNLATGTDQEYTMGYGIPNTVWQDGYAYEKLPLTLTASGIEILPQDPHTFYYNLTPGQEYTQTVWFETDATVKDLSASAITWFTNNGGGHDIQSATIINLGENKYKLYSTYRWPGKSDNNVRLFDSFGLDSAFDLSTGTYLKFSKLELEEGTVSHTWSPSPDDLQNQFTQIKTSIDGVATTINDPKTGLNATYQTAQGNATTISNVKGDVTQLQTTANGLTSRVGDLESKTNTQQTAIDQNKAAIALKADQTTVDTLKGTVSQNTATLKTQADQIQSKVSASDVSGMLTNYATQEYTQSLVTQKANEWNVNLTSLQTDVNAIKSTGGGVNLVQNTSTDIVIDATSSGSNNFTFATIFLDEQPKQGDLITISAEGTLTGTGTLDEYQVILYDRNTTKPRSQAKFLKAGQRDSVTLSLDNLDGNGDTVLLIYAGKAGETAGKKNVVHHLMVEKGTVAHDWSPAPSDMATVTSVTNLSATVNGIQAQVYNSDGSSKITQLSNLIATKVSQGDYNSQITQLNNAINQRVQVGDVISQINQEAGGDTLIQVSNGKKTLILDAANTIITGEAWIPSASISSISADKVMIGSSALYNSDGTLNLVNQSNGLKALIQVKQGLVQDTTQSIISFSSDYNNRAFSVTPVGATITPTLFFERYDQTAGHWLGFTRNEVRRDGLMFNTWDNEGERFFVACHARFDKNISAEGIIMQGTWNGTTGSPLAGILSIESGNTIWSGSGYLAVGDHISNSYTNVIAKSFSQQSTLSSKTNIETVDPKDALDLVNRTDIRSYQYKTDVAEGKTKRYTSLIIDDVNDVSQYYAPNEFTNEERTGRDDGSAVGYLFLAVQELTRRIKTLEEKLNG